MMMLMMMMMVMIVMMMVMVMMVVMMMMIDDDSHDDDYEDEGTSVIILSLPLSLSPSLSQVSGSRQAGIRTRGEIIIPLSTHPYVCMSHMIHPMTMSHRFY
jgi:hypothetical protein